MKTMPSRVWAIAALFFALFALNLPASAAGLGKLTIRSSLGQPLNGEIEITSLQPKEFESLGVKVAGTDLYQQQGIPYPAQARLIRLNPVKRDDGSAYLSVTSVSPINEPSLNMLVEFTWPNGRLVQKFPILLDPAR